MAPGASPERFPTRLTGSGGNAVIVTGSVVLDGFAIEPDTAGTRGVRIAASSADVTLSILTVVVHDTTALQDVNDHNRVLVDRCDVDLTSNENLQNPNRRYGYFGNGSADT